MQKAFNGNFRFVFTSTSIVLDASSWMVHGDSAEDPHCILACPFR